MTSNQDVVATTFAISQKEKELKQRFFSNQRTVTQKPEPKIIQAPDPKLHNFLDDMQNVLQQQTKGTMAGDLLKKQAIIMQEQVDIIKEDRKNLQEVIQHIAINQTKESQDPRRMMAELLAPLSKQILEVKNYYEETKTAAKDITEQVTNLKSAISEKRNTGKLQKSVELSINKYNNQKNQFQNKVKEAELMVNEVEEAAQENALINKCQDGIRYLREQIKAVKDDTLVVEKELQNRYKRIMEQCQTIKNLPTEMFLQEKDYRGAVQRIQERLGGEFNYDEILEEIENSVSIKNTLMLEYRQNTPTYPKLKKANISPEREKNVYQGQQTLKKKQTELHPAPFGGKKTFTIKPSNLTNLPTVPLKPPSPVPTKTKPPSFIKTAPKMPETQKSKETEPVKKFDLPSFTSKIPAEIQTEEVKHAPKPAPAASKSHQTKITGPEALENDLYSGLKSQETQNPPLQTLENQTTDAVTKFVLNQLLSKEKYQIEKPQGNKRKWLGVDGISDLVKHNLLIDSFTIEKVGQQVLEEEIEKMRTKNNKKEDSKRDESYADDFEEYNDDSKESALVKEHKNEVPKIPIKKQEEESKKNTPMISPPESGDIESLLNPRLLGMMSAAAVQHYITALIESGHLARAHSISPPSLFDRNSTPPTQIFNPPVQTPMTNQNQSDFTILPPQIQTKLEIPEELKGFFDTPIGEQLLRIIKENKSQNPQQILEEWIRRYMTTPRDAFTPLNLQYPPRQEFNHDSREKSIFGDIFASQMPKPEFNAEKEENVLKKESMAPRRVFDIPILNLQKAVPSSPGTLAFLLSESESSSGISSGSVGSELFFSENPGFLSGFIDFVKKSREIEEGQVPGSYETSEGEVKHPEIEGLSSGEIPSEVLLPSPLGIDRNWDRVRISTSDLLSNEETFEKSEGEFDPAAIFSI